MNRIHIKAISKKNKTMCNKKGESRYYFGGEKSAVDCKKCKEVYSKNPGLMMEGVEL